MELAGSLEALHVEHDIADRGRRLGVEVAHLAADHPGHDLRLGGLGDAVGGDVGAVAHHRDGVAEGEDLVEAMGDEDQGATLVAQAAGNREEAGYFVATESGGRLVHDEQPGVEGDGLGDLDDLLVGDGQTERRAARVDVYAQPLEEGARLAVHAGPVDPPAAAEGHPAHEDVLGDRQVGEERRLLVDDGDARVLRLGRGAEVDLLAAEQELSAIAPVDAGDDLDQRRLARTVLADQRVDGAGLDPDASGPQGDDRAERLGHVAQVEDRVGPGRCRRCRHGVLCGCELLKGFNS